VPPGLLRDPAAPETLEGERILAEYPDDRGVLLWQSYRDGILWAGTLPEKRRGLFHGGISERRAELLAGAGLDAALSRALQALHAGLRARGGDDGAVAQAALEIARAAERDQAAATAIAFARLAAVLDPAAASSALTVGRIALGFGHATVAETWLRRAVGLARRDNDWAAYGGSLLALAQLREEAERFSEAHTEYRRALRLGRRRGLAETRRRAFHGLLRVALRNGEYPAALLYARGARRSHDPGHPDRGCVLLDVAELELRIGNRARAAALLREALASCEGTGEQVRALTMLVRAAEDRAVVEEAWHRAAELIETRAPRADAARLLLDLARACAETHDDRHADLAAWRALACATQAGSAALEQEISAFLARPRTPRTAAVS
jgi:tetratricopeptide (TPR) repeat protein